VVNVRNIGIQVKPPEGTCNDQLCPFHGHLKVRGIILTGTVYKKKMKNTIIVRRDYLHYSKKVQALREKKEQHTSPLSTMYRSSGG